MARRYVLIVLVFFCGWLRPAVEGADAQETSPQVEHLFLSPLMFPLLSTSDVTAADPVDAFPEPPELIEQTDLLEADFETRQPELLQQLLKREEPHVTWRLTALSPSADTTLISEGAFAAGPPDSFSQTRPLTDWHHRIRLIHERPWENSRYGVNYQYEGNEKDRDRFETWSEWEFGKAKLKTSVARLEDNVGKAPHRPRITTLESQLAMEFGITN